MESLWHALALHFSNLTPAFLVDLGTDYGVFLLGALGLYILMSAGQVSLGHAAMLGISAYASGVLAVNFGASFLLCLGASGALGVAVGAAYCFILGSRLSGFYLAIGTFALGEMLINLWLNTDYLGGAIGFSGIPLRTRWPIVCAVLPLALLLLWRLENSRFGLEFRAIRDNPIVAGSMGVDVARTRMLAWMFSGFLTGLAGCLHAHRVTVLSPTDFGIYQSVTILMAPLLGGTRSFWGTVIGGAVIYFGPWLTTTSEPRDRLMLYGALIVALMVLRPQGLFAPRARRQD
jgi:branched-chain amino acid transport system permease protein